MNKIKLNAGLASVILVASLFSGWSTLLLVTLLMFLFCEVDEKVKGVAVKVIAFFIGITLVGYVWDLLYDGLGLILSEVGSLVNFINDLFNASLDLTKVYDILNPLYDLCGIADRIISYVLRAIEILFIINVFANKPMKDNVFIKQINKFVASVVTYINSIDVPVQAAPAAPAAPVAPETPVQ